MSRTVLELRSAARDSCSSRTRCRCMTTRLSRRRKVTSQRSERSETSSKTPTMAGTRGTRSFREMRQWRRTTMTRMTTTTTTTRTMTMRQWLLLQGMPWTVFFLDLRREEKQERVKQRGSRARMRRMPATWQRLARLRQSGKRSRRVQRRRQREARTRARSSARSSLLSSLRRSDCRGCLSRRSVRWLLSSSDSLPARTLGMR
mmetsp:Transcript_44340/g.105055  ORF Transcript_44340/g.105055 Transcript_44340/m.105055 type:complete len:203 (-) Transcript_44340:1007-1615(-)